MKENWGMGTEEEKKITNLNTELVKRRMKVRVQHL